MFTHSGQVLGQPQIDVQITLADWRKFLGNDSAPAGFLPVPGVRVVAKDPVLGEAEFMLAYGVAGLVAGDAVTIGVGYATTRSVAASRGVAAVAMVANTDPTALSWFQIGGIAFVRATAATANLPLYTTATAGALATTVTATQQVTGGTAVLAPGSTITTKNCGTFNGSNQLQVPNLDGVLIGMTVAGTGIPGGTTILTIGEGGEMLGALQPSRPGFVTLSANSTATGTVAVTFGTGANFALAQLARPVAAGLG